MLFNLYFWHMSLGIRVLMFMVKLPVYRGHYWLIKAHVECHIIRSALLAGLLLKYGRSIVIGGISLFSLGLCLTVVCVL